MKKFLTTQRIIMILGLILVYSCAFLFVKVYAEKAIIDDSEPSSAALYVKDGAKGSESENENGGVSIVTTAPIETAPPATSEITTAPTSITTAPTTTEPPETTTAPTTTVTTTEGTTTQKSTEKTTEKTEKKTEKSTKTTESTKAAKPTKATEPEPEELDDDNSEDLEGNDKEQIDEVDEEITAEEDETPEEAEDPSDNDPQPLTPDELQQILDNLYNDNPSAPTSPAPVNPSDVLVSQNSYKNQLLTIYDTKNKCMRTENAFDIVCEITNYEVGDSMDPEAIKAQAVAAYTYCKYYEQKGEYAEIGTKGDVPQLVKQCVEAVDGLAMFYDGKYISAPFSASTGGYSASSKNVWGGDLPYLQSVPNEYDYLDTKNYGKVTTYTVDEVRNAIESKTDIKLSNNYSEWIKILSYNDTIYAGNLSIDGHTECRISGKNRTITAHYFRTYILKIRSAVFSVSYSNGVFTFVTYGYGHGVGLSQVGANLYATYGGYTFDQILHHYFTGITIC